MGSIKKQPKCVKYWNMLAIKGLYLDISDWFWLFGRSKYINYIYDFKNKYGNVPQSCPPDNELKDSWNKLSVSLQWSNLYSAYSISPKLRSIGITDGYVKLDNDQITLLAEVEHNRWNMEKLLLGFRKPTAEEEELIYGSKEMGDIFKKKRFVHPDIRPYDELKESSKAYDRCITAGIPLVVNNNT